MTPSRSEIAEQSWDELIQLRAECQRLREALQAIQGVLPGELHEAKRIAAAALKLG